MKMLNKPYYRVFRPFLNPNKYVSPEHYEYLEDKRNCNNKSELIRIYKIIYNEFLNILNYIEPINENFDTYSLKNYHLLCQVCMEIENNFKGMLKTHDNNGENIKDYFKLNKHLKLNEYSVSFLINNNNIILTPFLSWNTANYSDYSKLSWYQSYNYVKHNRSIYFKEASLKNILDSLSALYILLHAQFGSFSEVITSKNMASLATGDGIYFISDSLFSISNSPNWEDEEKYDFNWTDLKNDESPFNKLIIS